MRERRRVVVRSFGPHFLSRFLCFGGAVSNGVGAGRRKMLRKGLSLPPDARLP